MKLKLKLFLIAILTLIASLCLLPACGIGQEGGESVLKKAGMNYAVIYYGDGGYFNGNQDMKSRQINYSEGSPIINIGEFEVIGGQSILKVGYVLQGWYYAQLEEDGTPKYADEAKTVLIASDEPAEFPMYAQKSGKIYLVAVWTPDVRINVVAVCEGELKADDATYQSGDVVAQLNFGRSGSVIVGDKTPMESTTHTFLQYYADEACTDELAADHRIPKPTDGADVSIYAKYIEGQWKKIIKTADDFNEMLNGADKGGKYYLFKDIVYDKSFEPRYNASFSCVLEGNGHTVSGMSATIQGSGAITSGDKFSFFGRLTLEAAVKDLTITNISVSVPVRTGPAEVYALFTGAEQGATIQNLTVEGLTLTVNKAEGASLTNIPEGESGFTFNNWLFGGFDSNSSAGESFTGLKVTNAQIIVSVNGTDYSGELSINENNQEAK